MSKGGEGKRPEPRGPARRPRRKRKKASGQPHWGWAAAYYATLTCVWCGVIVAGVLAYFAADLPSTEGLRRHETSHAVTLLDAKGRMIARRGIDGGMPVTLADLPPYVPEAVIATEDRRFYSHWGIDPWGLGRALWVNWEAGHVVQGGSTITQQLAKNLFLEPERTISRKVQEALLAVYLEMSFSKDEILALYLNRVYFGAGAFGIDAAARRYFNKPASKLTMIEAAILAGLLKAPTRYSPVHGIELAQQRATLVLDAMVDAGYITSAQKDDAMRTRPKLATGPTIQGNQYFADWIMERLPHYVGRPDVDLVVQTTLDLDMQREAETAVQDVLQTRGVAVDAGQGALVAMSTDGAVRAMVGGRSYMRSEFNRATLARRQPGSAFKPFVYLTAIENGRTPTSRVVDAPVTYRNWTPQNFDEKYEGEMSLTDALAHSVNSVAVRLCLELGPSNVAATAHRLGITSRLTAVPSLALGTSEVTLFELTKAYVPFATGGRGAIAHGIDRVRAVNGDVLYARRGSGLGNVVDASAAGAMNRMLSEAMRTGTGKSAALAGRPTGGKTGTTQDFRDAWFVGYTGQLVTGVWVGNDSAQPMKKVTGGTLPAAIWKNFMQAATANDPVVALPGTDVVDAEPQVATNEGTSAFDQLLSSLFESKDDKPKPAPVRAN
ncbi:MAG: PBP1A family penicillin-binding protein [Alphaproteobacteria bacterium]|nr:PBP1A family penicillin-binding protein [Alphaproteobacteria bacterium]